MPEIRDKRTTSWFWMENAILDTHGKLIGHYGVAVYALLARHANNNGQAFPSLHRLAEGLGISRSTVLRTLEKLVQANLIHKEERFSEFGDHTSNVYTLLSVEENEGGGIPQTPPSTMQTPQVVSHRHHRGIPQTPPTSFLTRPTEPDLIEQEKPLGHLLANARPSAVEKYTDKFVEFWQTYPVKRAKGGALKAWKRLRIEKHGLADTVIASIAVHQSNDPQWQVKEFIPYPATYLNQRRWEDELEIPRDIPWYERKVVI